MVVLHPKSKLPGSWIGIQRGWQFDPDRLTEWLVSLPPSELKYHLGIWGQTGSGKTVFILSLIAQALQRGDSFVVIDARGTLVADILTLCRGHVPPHKIRLFDLREKRRVVGYDPLAGRGDSYFRALLLLSSLEKESSSWGVQLAETAMHALLLLSEAGERLPSIERLFFDIPFLLTLLPKATSPATISFWQRFAILTREKQAVLASPVLNKLSSILTISTLRRMLEHRKPVDLRAHLDEPGSIILISLACDELHGAGRAMGRVMFSSIRRELFGRVEIPEVLRNPVQIFADECQQFNFEDFEEIIAEGRKFKVSCVMATQTMSQLPPAFRALMLGNIGVRVAFAVSRDDSRLLSREFTGNPDAFALSQLKTGEAVVWTRDKGCRWVEMNEPLIKNSGELSPATKAYRDAIYDAAQAEHVGPPSSRDTGARAAQNQQPEADQGSDEPKSDFPFGGWQ